MDLSKFSRDDRILAGVALLLAIDLLFLPWFDITVSFGGFHASATSTATGAPDGWLGVLAAAGVAGSDRRSRARAPRQRRGPRDQRKPRHHAARDWRPSPPAFVALKFLFHIHFSFFGIGFWAAIVLAAALVVIAVRARDAERLAPTLA